MCGGERRGRREEGGGGEVVMGVVIHTSDLLYFSQQTIERTFLILFSMGKQL